MTDSFRTFADLHIPGDPLILFNVWDAGSARAAERAGARAIATGSASVATAHGYDDAEALPLDLALANADRVVRAVGLPVSIDFESGYAVAPELLSENFARLAATRAVGANFEDQRIGAEGIYPIADQAARIAAAVRGVPAGFFLNARTDIFLQAPRETHDDAKVDAAIERAHAYAEAGARGIFVPGLVDLALLERFCAATPLPVNFMAFPDSPPARDIARTGVARISHGPFPHLLTLKAFEDAARRVFD